MREIRLRRRFRQALLPLAVLGAAPLGADQAAAPTRGWSGRANLNLASSFGNAGSGSIGLSAETARGVGRFRLAFDGGLLRTSTDRVTREAVGAPESFGVVRRVESRVSADRTHLRARISEASPPEAAQGLNLFASAGWERDAPAGVRARYDLTAGVGTSWGGEEEGTRPLELGLGLSFVHQSDAVADPEIGRGSLGLRLDGRSEGRYRAADLGLVAASTWNLRNRDDLRLDVTGSVAFPLAPRLAFRTSVQTLFDSRPSLERVALRAFPGGPVVQRVATPRARLDLILLASVALRW